MAEHIEFENALQIRTCKRTLSFKKTKEPVLAIEVEVYTYRQQTCTRSFDMGLTSVEGKKLECFRWTTKKYFITTMKPNL